MAKDRSGSESLEEHAQGSIQYFFNRCLALVMHIADPRQVQEFRQGWQLMVERYNYRNREIN